MSAAEVSSRTATVVAGSRPTVLIIGGEDVDKRIDLMLRLAGGFRLEACGAGDLSERFANHGFAYHFFPMKRGLSVLGDVRTFRALRRIIRSVQPDIVHTFATKPTIYGRLAARAESVPCRVGTVAGLGSLYASEAVRARALRRVYEVLQRRASRGSVTVFQNRHDKDLFVTRGITTDSLSVVIPGSGVDTDYFSAAQVSPATRLELRKALGLQAGSVVVTMVSRVMRSKGVLDLAAAAGQVTSRNPNVEFLLVGPDDQDSLDRLTATERSELSDSVHWVGEREDIRGVLAATDIFVLPTYYREGLPRVLLEASAMGLPLVASRWPGCEDIVREDDNGILVRPRDPGELSRAILRLAEDPDLREEYGRGSRRVVESEYTVGAIALRTASLYQDLLAAEISG